MTNIKISELDELVNVADNDYLPIVDTSENETKKVAIQRIGAGGKSGDTLPIGSIVPYGNETAPANWLICDGSAISRTTYADLFAVIGTNFGSGDGSTTFNLPNMKGKVAVGLDSNDSDFNSIGKTGGGKTHTLTVEEIPSHTHLMEGVRKWVGSETGNVKWPQDGEYQHAKEGMPTDYTGGNQSHNNLQPYQVQNYIIKAFQSAGVIGNVVKVKTNSDTDTYSCDYINGIVESGSTDTGNWVKYMDGTMICYNKKSMTEFTNQYYHGYTGNWMYPAEFVEYPTVIATIDEWTTYDLTFKAQPNSTTAANVMYFVKNPTNNTYIDNHFEGNINLIAIGKWK